MRRFFDNGLGVIFYGLFFGLSLSVLQANAQMRPLPDAQNTVLAPLQTGDDARGWQAVGKLVLGKRGFCTGVLIAPDQVLTAAHCLFERGSGQRLRDEQIAFHAGWRNGRAEAYRGVIRSLIHPSYSLTQLDDLARVPVDLALLELDQPILLPHLRPFLTAARPDVKSPVTVVSYALDRAEAPALERDCQVMELAVDPLVLTCDIDFGSSGAPVFSVAGDGAMVVAVISAKADYGGRKVALGVALDTPLAQLRESLARAHAKERDSFGINVLSGGRADRASSGEGMSGAKFHRP